MISRNLARERGILEIMQPSSSFHFYDTRFDVSSFLKRILFNYSASNKRANQQIYVTNGGILNQRDN